jgi:type II secretory pathway predicted ATPase ExeA/cell division septation protein DedD
MYRANDRSPRPLQDGSAPRSDSAAFLTYEPFFGLAEKPFSLSADPRFLFRSPAHGPAFDELLAGIRRREGLIVLTGEIGTGKTTLCRAVLQHLDRRTFAAFVADPFVSREDLLKTLLVDFGVISIGDLTRGRFNGASRTDLSYPLYEFLDSLVPLQAFAVVVIDEAQNLSLPLLEEIRILSELERREKLLQVVLVGQPELRSNLKLPEMRQVDQRVSVRCELTPLNADGVAGYVNHRLRVAGRGMSGVEFTRAALEAVYRGSSGIPRLINRICDRALQRAYGSQSRQIDVHSVWAAFDDLGLETAVAVQQEPSPEKSFDANRQAAFAEPTLPAPPPAPTPPTMIAAPAEPAAPTAIEIAGEGYSSLQRESIARSSTRGKWISAALLLAAAAALGTAVWYARAQAVDSQELVALMPPPPASTVSQTFVDPPRADPELLRSLQTGSAPPASPAAPGRAAVPTPPRVPPSTAVPGTRGAYTILVASFKNPKRAERLIDELTNAGFGAHAVERDGGPERGRFVQVMISGYTSAIDVQRDLQRIRALPGGYTDARIVEHQ